MKRKEKFVLTLAAAALFTLSASAAVVPIVNPGFEQTPLDNDAWNYMMDNEGWGYVANAGNLGSWNVTTAEYPGEAPEAVFKTDAQNVTAREYCNLHGLWKG